VILRQLQKKGHSGKFIKTKQESFFIKCQKPPTKVGGMKDIFDRQFSKKATG